jgi:hypothetical protein
MSKKDDYRARIPAKLVRAMTRKAAAARRKLPQEIIVAIENHVARRAL